MYDLIIEIAHTVWRNGFGLTALGTAVFVLLKQRKVKKQLRKYIPWLLEDESETKQYVANQQIIIHNLKRLMERMGLEWDVPTSETLKGSTSAHKTFYTSSSVGSSVAQGAARRGMWSFIKSNIRRVNLMKNKWKSRKFWMSIIAAALVIANEGLDLGISTETVMTFAGLIASFIFSEAYVDAKKKTDYPGDTGPAE